MRTKLLFLLLCALNVFADDGYRLWLKYDLVQNKTKLAEYKQYAGFLRSEFETSPIISSAIEELNMALKGMLGVRKLSSQGTKGGIVFRRNTSHNAEGYEIKTSGGNIIIEAATDKGILYGTFAYLRLLQTEQTVKNLKISESPKIQLRMLNHWDNVNGTIERGYAGASLWKWYELPETVDPRYKDYARANASIGINAVSVNNVNASTRFLTKEYLPKVKALADVFRPYGIKVFLSLNFASPKTLGGLKTSDPLDPAVRKWWADKTAEIHQYIPDFGGFLVKANSEGEPGPQEHGRTHADGANMLSEAIKPFGGVVIWRAFVYAANPNGDRFKEAFNEFKPLDGQFNDNVIVQVKNGPIDFMPREPFHPLFGAMPNTPLAMEFQITQEYLGFSTNMVFLPSLFKEVLNADTYAKGQGSTVAKVVDGSMYQNKISAIAGVANTGSDRNWTGHLMSQANWYGYGRLAWNHETSEAQIAEEWSKMTLTKDKTNLQTIKEMLLASHQIYVNHTNPLGLHHIMGQGIHWGPEPWLARSQRPDWTAIYYHKADSLGLGFNRLSSGSNAISLYHPEVQKKWNNPAKTDINYLLWFHHVPWTDKLSTGNTLWEELCARYYNGIDQVKNLQNQWGSLKGIDPEIFADVKGRLAVQHREAHLWRDASLLYFQTFSKQEIPSKYQKPIRTLEEIKETVRIYQLR